MNTIPKIDWKSLERPIVALSPMADMTDSPFCRIVRRFGGHILFREMVSSEALVRGSEKTLDMARWHPEEAPIVQQIFGKDPDTMAEAARIVERETSPQGIDINMGCPVYKITSDFNGAALMKEPELAAEMVRKMKAAVSVPISVKIRLGWDDPTTALDFAPRMEEAGAELITVHGRTKAQGYSGVADWEMVGGVKERVSIPVLVNGDVHSAEAAVPAMAASGADGILIARGALGAPWRLAQIEEMLKYGEVRTVVDDELFFRTILDHTQLMIEQEGERGVVLMRKHFSWYFKGRHGAKEIRGRLVKTETLEEVKEVLAWAKTFNPEA